MKDVLILYGQGTAASTYFYTGFVPGYVRVDGWGEEDSNFWCPLIPGEDSIEIIDSTGIRELDTSDGVRLVKFSDEPGTVPGSGGTPSDVENGRWWEANGIEITGSCAAIADGNPYSVLVFRMTVPIIRAVHDGTTSSGTYFEDSSIDFLEAGVSPNGKFIIINETNDNYAYVGSITKPSGKTRHCRIYTYEDEGLATATAAADFDTSDVCFIIPRQWAQSPLSGIGLMT